MPPFPSSEWASSAVTALHDDAQFQRSCRAFDATVRFDFDEESYAISIDEGTVELHEDPTFVTWDFALRASEETWEKLFAETPPPMYNDLLGLWLRGPLTMEGDLKTAIQHLEPLKRLLVVFRQVNNETPEDSDETVASTDAVSENEAVSNPEDFDHGETEAMDAGYVWLEFEGDSYRTYYETAGDGDVPLVLLHTASADSRQYRHLMNDADLLEEFTLYAFDVPWHGNSFPPMTRDWWNEDYRMTTEFYAGFVMTFVRAFDLDQPAVMGCSMGGAIVLELAISYAEELRAVVGLESTAFAPTRDIGYLDHPHINQEVVRPEWTYGLQAPQSPEQFKRESWWTYSQGGDGVYVGDLHFYTEDWDVRDELGDIDTDECSVYLLTGDYDFSASPEDTSAVADEIDGAAFTEMEGMGHFPMVENPALFKEYLDPVFESVLSE